jgi:heat shock protein HslJ
MGRSISLVLLLSVLLSACGGSEGDVTTSSFTDDMDATDASDMTSPPIQTTSTEGAASTDAPELGDTDWNVTDYKLPSGTITNVWKTEVTISFSADGTVSGSAGCNDFQGNWSVSGDWNEFEEGVPDEEDGQELILESLSWTEMACEDEDIMQQESEILDLLQNAGRWVLIRGNFNLRDAEGSFLFEAEPV